MLIDTPLLVIGEGPAALVVAKVAAGYGLACLLVGHEVTGDDAPLPLAPDAVAALRHHGLFDILRPYLVALDPPTLTPLSFEEVVKHHCVADLNVTVYDQMDVIERRTTGAGTSGVLTDGRSRWNVSADVFVDADAMPRELSAAIMAGEAAALDALDRYQSAPPR